MSELDQLYQQVIMDHARERHGHGPLPGADAESFQVNPTCGDETTVRVKLMHDGASLVLDEVAWEGHGCQISQASLSVMHDLTRGRPIADVDRLGEVFREMMHSRGSFPEEKLDDLEDGAAFLGASKLSARVKCALLGWMALRAALAEALTAEPKEQS